MKNLLPKIIQILPGFLFIFFISLSSFFLSSYMIIGTVAIAITLGMIINNLFSVNHNFESGISFCEKTILNCAIVLMGAQLNYATLSMINYQTISIILLLIVFAMGLSLILGKIFKISSSLSLLLGVGNGVCGSSAIAGASSIVKAKSEDVAISISVINLLGSLGIFLVPALIHYFNITSEYQQSVVVGSTIQAVGQVTAAGYIMGDEVGRFATLIKMVRILALGPLLVILSFVCNTFKSTNKEYKSTISIPSFIVGFVVFSILSNVALIPDFMISHINDLSKCLLIMAMAAIGMKVSFSSLFRKGYKVIFVAFITFLLQILFCVYLIA